MQSEKLVRAILQSGILAALCLAVVFPGANAARGDFRGSASRAEPPAEARARDDSHIVRLRRGPVDTRGAVAASRAAADSADDLYLVQCVAPVKDSWREDALRCGLAVIAPVPDNALLVRGSAAALDRFVSRPFVEWHGHFTREARLDPNLDEALAARASSLPVAVQILADAAGERLAARLERESAEVFVPASRFGGFVVVRCALPADAVEDLLRDPAVVNVEPWRAPRMQDERAGVIAAGMLDASGRQPEGPGYLDWLASKGFSGETFDFGIDFTDSGLDRGAIDDPAMHPDFRSASGSSRISYATSYIRVGNQSPGDFYGHGTLNASIAVGYNAGTGSPLADALGYRHGLGVAPFVRLGSSKIFDRGDSISLSASFTSIVKNAYRNGMRFSSNSWGAAANVYTVESQEYDAIVRDADPDTPGNQEMCVLFAAGNAYGGGNILTPATAKNVISVGASENFRPEGITDRCGVGDLGSDSADDVIDFSSGGPVDDGRIKPDIVAPGTHMQGAASQNGFYNGQALCVNVPESKYFPEGQTLYAWASGTSQSTPVVAGAAALVREYVVMNEWLPGGAAPSPAMLKALLLGAATPMNGARAGKTLPDARQGYGRVSLEPIVDDAARVLVDQTIVFDSAGLAHEIEGSVGDPERPFRVALVWTDAPALPAFAPRINDLDLEVRVGEDVYRGNVYSGFFSAANPEAGFDALNNVETVTIPAGVRGPFTVTVRAATIAGDGIPGNADLTDQDFALVIYNIDDGRWTPKPVPLVTRVDQRGARKLFVYGDRFTATSRIEINGAAIAPERVKFITQDSSFRVKGPASALNLVQGANTLVVIDGDLRSEPFRFERSRPSPETRAGDGP